MPTPGPGTKWVPDWRACISKALELKFLQGPKDIFEKRFNSTLTHWLLLCVLSTFLYLDDCDLKTMRNGTIPSPEESTGRSHDRGNCVHVLSERTLESCYAVRRQGREFGGESQSPSLEGAETQNAQIPRHRRGVAKVQALGSWVKE